MASGLSVACMCQISSLLFDSHILICVPPCAGNLSWLPSVVANQLGRAVAEVLNSLLSSPSSDPASTTKFSRAGDLLDALRLHTAADQQLLATAVTGPIAGALVGSVQQGNAPPEAASLLASLVKQFGSEVMRAAPTGAVPGAGHTTGAVLPKTFGCAPESQDVTAWQTLVKFCNCQMHDICVPYSLAAKALAMCGRSRILSAHHVGTGLGWQYITTQRYSIRCSHQRKHFTGSKH